MRAIRKIIGNLIFFHFQKTYSYFFRVIKLDNGLVACLIADSSPIPPESDELSEDEGSSYETNSSDETGESTTSEDEEIAGNIEQKMVCFW